MFYCYDLLCLRKKGRYSIIWFAAHHGRSSRTLDFTKVDIGATCEELIETVMLPANAKHSASRLSLCLASKLMHGACVVYREQVVFFLRDVMCFLEKCYMSGVTKITNAMKRLEDNENADGEPLRKRKRMVKKKKELLPARDPNTLTLQEISMNEENLVQHLQKTTEKLPHIEEQLFIESSLNEVGAQALEQMQESSHPKFFGRTDPLILDEIVPDKGPTATEIPNILEPCQPLIDDQKMSSEVQKPKTSLPIELDEAPVPQIPISEDQEMSKPPEVAKATEVDNQVALEAQIKGIRLEEPTPKRPLSPNIVSKEQTPRKKSCILRKDIFNEDTILSWSIMDIRKFKYISREQEIIDEMSLLNQQQEDFLLYTAKLKFLRVQQEYIRKRRMSIRHEESSAQERLYGSSLSHLSHLSVDQADELKRIQEPLQVIPEQADISRASVIQPEDGNDFRITIVPEDLQPSEVILSPVIEPQQFQAEPPIALAAPDGLSAPEELLAVEGQKKQPREEIVSGYDKSAVSVSPRTKLGATRENLLEKLQDIFYQKNGEITFTDLCAPGKVKRMITAQIFNILLHLKKDNIVNLEQMETYTTIIIKKIY